MKASDLNDLLAAIEEAQTQVTALLDRCDLTDAERRNLTATENALSNRWDQTYSLSKTTSTKLKWRKVEAGSYEASYRNVTFEVRKDWNGEEMVWYVGTLSEGAFDAASTKREACETAQHAVDSGDFDV